MTLVKKPVGGLTQRVFIASREPPTLFRLSASPIKIAFFFCISIVNVSTKPLLDNVMAQTDTVTTEMVHLISQLLYAKIKG